MATADNSEVCRDHSCMQPANERWRYSVTPSLIGWAHKQNDPLVLDVYYEYLEETDSALTYCVPVMPHGNKDLAQVMACLPSSKLFDSNFISSVHELNLWHVFRDYTFTTISPRRHWVNGTQLYDANEVELIQHDYQKYMPHFTEPWTIPWMTLLQFFPLCREAAADPCSLRHGIDYSGILGENVAQITSLWIRQLEQAWSNGQ